MSRFWKFVIIVALVLGAMLLLTLTSPAIKEFAQGLAVSSKLPLWLVGLAAPILFVFKKLGEMLGGLFGGGGGTKARIDATNEAIKAKLTQVEGDVAALDEWRRTQIEPHLARIAQLEQGIDAMEGRSTTMSQRVPELLQGIRDATAERERLARELLQATESGGLRFVPAEENP